MVTPLPGSTAPVQAGFSASSRSFTKATDRNRIKRLSREAYRLQKHRLYQALASNSKQLAVFFIYTDKKIQPFDRIQHKISVILDRLIEEHLRAGK
jgi:ribonuclease P protein component